LVLLLKIKTNQYKDVVYNKAYKMQTLDIVNLIEKNPVSKLSKTYNGRLLNKIKNTFTEAQQQLFVASFYCYLNYNQTADFVIDFDNVWKWLGFTYKANAKTTLEKNFKPEIDYKCLFMPNNEQKTGRGGHNKETIMLSVKTFKRFCMKAGTSKANEIHEYFINLEELLQQTVQEESDELKMQLEQKTVELENQKTTSNREKELLREKSIVNQYKINDQCVYYGIIDNMSTNNEKLIKFGNSNNLKERVKKHKKSYTNFRLVNAFKVENKLEIENAMKAHNDLKNRQRTLPLNGTNHIELLAYGNLSFEKLDKIIGDIIKYYEYNPENYKKLVEENIKLKETSLLVQEENDRLKIENTKLFRRYNHFLTVMKINDEMVENLINNDDLQNTQNIPNTLELVINTEPKPKTYENLQNETKTKTKTKRSVRNNDGFFYFDGKAYKKIFGSREEVWNETAYKTTGELTKYRFIKNKDGKIVSKSKFIYSKIQIDNHLGVFATSQRPPKNR
jgi:hypothetical protein